MVVCDKKIFDFVCVVGQKWITKGCDRMKDKIVLYWYPQQGESHAMFMEKMNREIEQWKRNIEYRTGKKVVFEGTEVMYGNMVRGKPVKVVVDEYYHLE